MCAVHALDAVPAVPCCVGKNAGWAQGASDGRDLGWIFRSHHHQASDITIIRTHQSVILSRHSRNIQECQNIKLPGAFSVVPSFAGLAPKFTYPLHALKNGKCGLLRWKQVLTTVKVELGTAHNTGRNVDATLRSENLKWLVLKLLQLTNILPSTGFWSLVKSSERL